MVCGYTGSVEKLVIQRYVGFNIPTFNIGEKTQFYSSCEGWDRSSIL